MIAVYGTELVQRSQAYDLLSLAAAEQWDLTPLPELGRGERGKPYFLGLKGREFNLSHSGTMALCGLSDKPLGVDIQIIRTWRPGLPGRVCSPEELEWLARGELWLRFALMWAMKESRAKYEGTGLTRPISGIRVPLPEDGEDLMRRDGLWFRMYSGTGWRGAVCGLEPPPKVIRWVTV